MNKTKLITSLAEIAIIAGVGLLWHHIGYKKGYNKAVESLIPEIRTEIRYDTLRVPTPVFLTEYKDRIEYVPIEHTITVHDTTYVALERTVKSYGDSTYYAEVSGINPSLDYIEVYQKTREIKTYIQSPTPKRYDFISLEGGLMYDRQWMMPVTLNIGYIRGNFEASAGGGYDPLTQSAVFKADLALRFKW